MTAPTPPARLVEKHGEQIARLLTDPSFADPYDYEPSALGDLLGLWLAEHGRGDEAAPMILEEEDLPDDQRIWLERFLTLYRPSEAAEDERRRRERLHRPGDH